MRRLTAIVCLAASTGSAGLAAGTNGLRWQVDPALVTLNVSGELFADALDLPGSPLVPAVWRPYAIGCPAWVVPPAPSPMYNYQLVSTNQVQSPFFDGIATFDIGGGLIAATASDGGIAVPPVATADVTGSFGVRRQGRRKLDIYINTFASTYALADGYFARACTNFALDLQAQLERANRPLFIKVDARVIGSAFNDWECPNPLNDCLDPSAIGPFEDPGEAEADIQMSLGGTNILAFNGFVNEDRGVPFTNWQLLDRIRIDNPPGTLTADLTQDSSAWSQLGYPNDAAAVTGDDGSADLFVRISLTAVARYFDADMRDYMRVVPAGGAGPDYAFKVGRFEVTNDQFSDFLNDAEYDGGATVRGSNVVFQPTGEVMLANGESLFAPAGVDPSSQIEYDPSAPVGVRYSSVPAYGDHPVTSVSWIAAAKFCNWLTIVEGYSAGDCCYAEGPNSLDWRPVTISAADWMARDLNAAERQALIGLRGYRLPMDNLGSAMGPVGAQENAFNEWYKAAAYDPAGPPVDRAGPAGEVVTARHWIYGFGRDSVIGKDANYAGNGDPFDDGTAPIGYFDGVNALSNGDVTNDTNNPYGMYDMSGNVREWLQDRDSGRIGRHAVRGGGFLGSPTDLTNTLRTSENRRARVATVGFRVVQAPPCPGDVDGDLDVDLNDLTILLSNFGLAGGATLRDGDINGDGMVDLTDLAMLLSRFGVVC